MLLMFGTDYGKLKTELLRKVTFPIQLYFGLLN